MAIDLKALDRLREVVGGADEDLIEIVSSFLEEAPTLLRDLVQGLAEQDLALMRRSAHSLKSNARDMGAGALAEICAQVEMLANEGKVASARVVADAASALEAAISELRMITGLGQTS